MSAMRGADVLRLGALAIAWSLSFVFIRVVVGPLGPVWTATLRMLVAGVALCAFFALTGFDANLKDHAYVHIAAHASVDLAVPQYSVIHLSRYDADGRSIPGSLSMRDVIEHEFNTELVTLSGCSTAGGRVFSGDGALGLSFAILAGGSEAVLSTMWDASDAATAEVMNAFYRELIVNDIAAARALRLAQLSLLNESKWKSPRFWAAYALIGRPPTTNVSQPQ